MWILPKQLHTSAYVLDMAALISDLDEQSQICEPSLLARSKPSLARTWSQRWKRDSWTQHLSGRILKPSHGQSFVTAWTSSLEVIPANHSQQQASDSDEMIHDTSGLGSQMELELCDPEFASLRTSRDTSASDSERSSVNWKALVIRRRGEYSLRVKSAHLTNASASSSWPTCAARDWKGCGNAITRKDGKHRLDTLEAVVMYGSANWLTPATVQIQRADMQKRIDYRASIGRQYVPGSLEEQMQQHGQAVPDNHSTSGNRQESWATPSTMDHINVVRNPEERSLAANKGGCKNLREEVHQWATPRTGATDNSRPNNKGGIPLGDQARRAEQWATPRLGGEEKAETRLARGKDIGLHGQVGAMTNSAKLNPRWVETLMGLPIGWTMPSCSSPLTIAQTNCDCSETESCLQQQKELF